MPNLAARQQGRWSVFLPHCSRFASEFHHCKYQTPQKNHSARSFSRPVECRNCLPISFVSSPGELKSHAPRVRLWYQAVRNRTPDAWNLEPAVYVYLLGIQLLGVFSRFGHRIATIVISSY